MLPFHKILFPVDYSAPCVAVIPYVQEMACHFSAELTVCHAYAPLTAIVQSELLVTDPDAASQDARPGRGPAAAVRLPELSRPAAGIHRGIGRARQRDRPGWSSSNAPTW